MNLISIKVLRSAVALTAICLSATAATPPTPTTRIVAAANTFLSTLSEQQRKSVVFAFDDAQQRQRWSNFPTGIVQRGGIQLLDMTPAQRTAAMALLASILSPKGYRKVQEIMEGDEVNKQQEAGGGNRPGGGPRRGRTTPRAVAEACADPVARAVAAVDPAAA